jgi:hypothetical protein
MKYIPVVKRLGYDAEKATWPAPDYYEGDGYYYRVGGCTPTGPFDNYEEAWEAAYEYSTKLPN